MKPSTSPGLLLHVDRVALVVAELRAAALTDDTGSALHAALARHALQGTETSARTNAGTSAETIPRSGDPA